MKKYTVSYRIGAYWYQSEVFTSSSDAAMQWAKNIGGHNAIVVKEEEEV